MAQLKISSLSKRYGPHTILHDISLDVQSGEFISLLGPSGSGKTTLLRCLSGLDAPDQQTGTIEVDGEVLSSDKVWIAPEKRQFSMVFQNYAVWPHMTVEENVAFPLKVRKLPAQEIRAQTAAMLERVRLGALAKRYPHELSGGQQQRVAIARALVARPRILLLDEPLSNLDVVLRDELRGEIQRLQREFKITTVLVTHDQKEALSLSGRIVLLNQGRIDQVGVPEELYRNPPSEFAALFLAEAQILSIRGQEAKPYIPRRWKLAQGTGTSTGLTLSGEILTRSFLGVEYQYTVRSEDSSECLSFYHPSRLEYGARVMLGYS